MVSIAVVEDDKHVLDALRLVLEFEGWVVQAYVRGEAFLADFAHQRPDCVILDPHLRGISGADVARTVVDKAPIPIICLTAQPDSPITVEIERLRVCVTLRKPVSADKLIEHVHQALSNTER